jgi:hypothetical protein
MISFYPVTCVEGVSIPSQVEFVIYDRLATFTQISMYSLASAQRGVALTQKEFSSTQASAALQAALSCHRV